MTREEQKAKAQAKAWRLLEGFLEDNEHVDSFSYSEDDEFAADINGFKSYVSEELESLMHISGGAYDNTPDLARYLTNRILGAFQCIDVDRDALVIKAVEWFKIKFHFCKSDG